MKFPYSILLFILFLMGCSKQEKSPVSPHPSKTFTDELKDLKNYFKIPGLAAIIEQDGEIIYEQYLGQADLSTSIKVDSSTLFPIASLTKMFSSVLILKLAEQGKISLNDPINTYLSESTLSDSVLIKHVLSHTSQGKIGEQFYYSSRYSLLGQVIEKAANQPYAEVMEKEILAPLKLTNTFLLRDEAQVAALKVKLASPYILEDGIKPGFIDYGYSTSAGLVSTARDLVIFSKALDTNLLLGSSQKTKMFAPFKAGLPYGYGVFSQTINGTHLVWTYGQYDCYSALFLKVPAQKTTLILLANNNLMSDPARLIYGDVSASLFALSFLKNFIFDLPPMKLFHQPDSINFAEATNPKFLKKLVLAQALSESFMARYETNKRDTSAKLLEQVFKKYPDHQTYADLNLLHNLAFLKDVAFYKGLGEFDKFDEQIEQIGEKLLITAPNNPYLHIYLGTYYDRKGDLEKATFHFKSIVEAPNFSRNWYTVEAKNWLANVE